MIWLFHPRTNLDPEKAVSTVRIHKVDHVLNGQPKMTIVQQKNRELQDLAPAFSRLTRAVLENSVLPKKMLNISQKNVKYEA